ncbi:hypothetical protein B0H67DRAFT_324648 [Lasiosphaeris hirsuta]|uniref:Uncharacterized protein n=1 Tax=Lasiosphaeris hirsuta TaxID=260670 RepID=A0AA40A291_9PEZI|nr:hypothetical protein B0H67DRAFT_324648 [Lasiosphaeris hirsuta]
MLMAAGPLAVPWNGLACSRSDSRHLNIRGLQVIDCNTRDILPAPNGCQYAALGYIWGQTASLTAAQPMQPAGKLLDNVPCVVEDAMTASKGDRNPVPLGKQVLRRPDQQCREAPSYPLHG